MPDPDNIECFFFIYDFINDSIRGIDKFSKRFDIGFLNFSSAPGLLGSLLNMIYKTEAKTLGSNRIVCSYETYHLLQVVLGRFGPNYLVIHSFRFSLTS